MEVNRTDNENMEATSTSCSKKERNFPALDLKDQSTLSTEEQPVLVIHSPKTPTLSKKLKAVSLDSEPLQQSNTLEVSRDVFSMPNTPKRQNKQKLSCDFDDSAPKSTLAPNFSSNLKKFASNNSISGSQTLKTLPEINALQDFSDCPVPERQKVRAKGLLERRGSNASLTIDLGSTQNITDVKPVPLNFTYNRLNSAKSVSNLYLSSMSSVDKCICSKKCETKVTLDRKKSQEACGNCTIYESVPKVMPYKTRCQNLKRCNCSLKSRRKSLSNENLYVPPCGFCETENKEWDLKNSKGNCRRAIFPRQPELEVSQHLPDEVKRHMQNIQYLRVTGNTMSIPQLKHACEDIKKLNNEYWEVPLNVQEKVYVPGSQSKNRYKDVVPNENSRVQLPGNGYIHANYVKGPDYTQISYIATQGPLSNTCKDFWEMVWYSQCKCIVMLTDLVEKGRNKCELYFPLGKKTDTDESTFLYLKTGSELGTFAFEEKNVISFDKYQITYINQRDLDDCQIRSFELKNGDPNVKPRVIFHYWFKNWPDHKMANPEQVLKIAIDVLNAIEGDQAQSDQGSRKKNSDIDEQNADLNSCEDRSCQSNYNIEQSDTTEQTSCNLDRRVNLLNQEGECAGISTNILITNKNDRFTFNITEHSVEPSVEMSNINFNACSTLESSNTSKNCQDFSNIPMSTNVSDEIFINTSSSEHTATNSNKSSHFDFSTTMHKVKNKQSTTFQNVDIKTESSCSVTSTNNFTSSIKVEQETCSCNYQNQNESSVMCVCTENAQPCEVKNQNTSCHNESRHPEVDLRNDSTMNSKSREGSISDFNKETLSNRCSLDSKLTNLNKMADIKNQFKRELTSYSSSERRKSTEQIKLPVVVHCSAGIGRTGCFLAILNGIQQLRLNKNVDILAILCSLRLNRGGMVQTHEQYELIHRVLSLYSDIL